MCVSQPVCMCCICGAVDCSGPADTLTLLPLQDCTTNPSLCYQAVQDPEYQGFLQQALQAKAAKSNDPARPYAGEQAVPAMPAATAAAAGAHCRDQSSSLRC